MGIYSWKHVRTHISEACNLSFKLLSLFTGLLKPFEEIKILHLPCLKEKIYRPSEENHGPKPCHFHPIFGPLWAIPPSRSILAETADLPTKTEVFSVEIPADPRSDAWLLSKLLATSKNPAAKRREGGNE